MNLSVLKYSPISSRIPLGNPACMNLFAFLDFSIMSCFFFKLGIICKFFDYPPALGGIPLALKVEALAACNLGCGFEVVVTPAGLKSVEALLYEFFMALDIGIPVD